MSAQNSSGIQTLLEAERKAHDIVQNARSYRTQRLKAAKTDAAQEIDDYRKSKENEFKQSESKNTGSNDQAEKEAEQSVQGELEDIKKKEQQAKDEVVKKLISAVMTPKPEMHINAK